MNAMIDRLEQEVDMLDRHLEVPGKVLKNEPIGIVRMSNETGHPHHKIRYSLRVLEEESSLLCRAVECPHSKAVDDAEEGCAGEIQRTDESKCVSGLFQAVLGQAAKFP